MEAIRNGANILRLFILSSNDPQLLYLTLLNAHVQQALGIKVRIAELAQIQPYLPAPGTIITSQDTDHAAYHRMDIPEPTTEVTFDRNEVIEISAHYDAIFYNEEVSIKLGDYMKNWDCPNNFYTHSGLIVDRLKEIEKLGSFSAAITTINRYSLKKKGGGQSI